MTRPFRRASASAIDELQASFDTALDARFSSMRAALRDPAASSPAAKTPAALRIAAAAKPGSYRAQMALGQALAGAGRQGGVRAARKGGRADPGRDRRGQPACGDGRGWPRSWATRRARSREYRALLANDHTAVDPARRLAELADKAGDEEAAALGHERVVALDPFDAQSHTGLGRIALKRKDAATATREFKVALAIGPADKATAHCDLGEAYLLAGKPADAKREALAALEIAPSFERAQDLLLKAVEGKDGKGDAEGRR